VNTAIWVAIIGGVTSIIVVVIPVLINWFNRRMDKREDDCRKELAEMRKEYKKAIELAIEKSRNL
jgi:hypothetical protein